MEDKKKIRIERIQDLLGIIETFRILTKISIDLFLGSYKIAFSTFIDGKVSILGGHAEKIRETTRSWKTKPENSNDFTDAIQITVSIQE